MIENLPKISVVTPTFRRPNEVRSLLLNLSSQTVMPTEVILVDGAAPDETETSEVVAALQESLPYTLHYMNQGGGTAIQRNFGIDEASGDLIAFVDDDVTLEPDFFEKVVEVFSNDANRRIGGIVGYRTNRYFSIESAQRWKWYRRLSLLKVFEPGRYDFETGYPINNNMQPPFTGVRPVDFMTTACAVWRAEVTDSGLRFDPFFKDYGVLEDAHFSLRAKRHWELLQCGDARCVEMNSPNGRVRPWQVGFKSVVNYYYVFQDIVGPLSARQKLRFWRYQVFELFRMGSSAIRRLDPVDAQNLLGRLTGFWHVMFKWKGRQQENSSVKTDTGEASAEAR